MHGGGENENTIFSDDVKLDHMLDHMIMNGDIEPMIVVTPTFNKCEAATFYKELRQSVIPFVEGKYSTYAKSTSEADLIASRMHRAYGGFSMGSLSAWCVGNHSLDMVGYLAHACQTGYRIGVVKIVVVKSDDLDRGHAGQGAVVDGLPLFQLGQHCRNIVRQDIAGVDLRLESGESCALLKHRKKVDHPIPDGNVFALCRTVGTGIKPVVPAESAAGVVGKKRE